MALGEYTCEASLRMPPGNEDCNKVWLLFTMTSSTFGIISVPLKRQVSKKEMDKKISHPKVAFPLFIGDKMGGKGGRQKKTRKSSVIIEQNMNVTVWQWYKYAWFFFSHHRHCMHPPASRCSRFYPLIPWRSAVKWERRNTPSRTCSRGQKSPGDRSYVIFIVVIS